MELKNIHSQAQKPLLSTEIFRTVKYNSHVHLMTTYIRLILHPDIRE